MTITDPAYKTYKYVCTCYISPVVHCDCLASEGGPRRCVLCLVVSQEVSLRQTRLGQLYSSLCVCVCVSRDISVFVCVHDYKSVSVRIYTLAIEIRILTLG